MNELDLIFRILGDNYEKPTEVHKERFERAKQIEAGQTWVNTDVSKFRGDNPVYYVRSVCYPMIEYEVNGRVDYSEIECSPMALNNGCMIANR